MRRRAVIPAAVAALVSLLLFYSLYLTDNKYTHTSPQAEQGILLLEGGGPRLLYLTEGWEFYQYRLLSPEDFVAGTAPAPTDYIFIGQYMGFDMDNITSSPFGSATYRMNIFTGLDEPKSYTLELPEIFSSYNLWINGSLLAQNGNPDPSAYKPEMSHGSITFTAEDRIDIVLAVSNFGHYYSGMVYPPAFGQTKAVNRIMDVSVLISALRCFFSVAVGLFYIGVGRLTRDKKTALVFGVLCFLYAGSASHQLVHFVSSDNFTVWYAIEDFCFYALLAGFAYISAQMFREQSKYIHVIPVIGVIAGFGVVLSSSIFSGVSAHSVTYLSLIVNAYKCLVICYLFYVLANAAAGGVKYSPALLAAVSVFGVSLAVDMAVINYEPMRYGWPTETGGFTMVLVLGIIITLDTVDGLRDRMNLMIKNEQLGMSYELLTQKIEQAKKHNHDLRHHMAVLCGYVNSRDIDAIAAYILSYTQNLPTNHELHFSTVPAVDAVARYYYALAKNDGVDVSISISLPETTLPEQELCVLFGNLLENAIDACKYVEAGEKYIRFAVRSKERFVTIVSDNSFDGVCREDGGALLSRKRQEIGVGTASIRAIAERYEGYADFSTSGGEFRASVVLQLMPIREQSDGKTSADNASWH